MTIMAEFRFFPPVTGVTDVTLNPLLLGRDGGADDARHAARHRASRGGFPHGLAGLHGAVQRHAQADRSRLRPRPRDVAVRRPRGCAAGTHPPADPRLLLPGHGGLLHRPHDPGADHGRHRQRRPRRAGQRPAGPEDGRQPVVPPADTGQDDDVAAADGRRQHGPGLLQRQLAHLQARRQGTERCRRVLPRPAASPFASPAPPAPTAACCGWTGRTRSTRCRWTTT